MRSTVILVVSIALTLALYWVCGWAWTAIEEVVDEWQAERHRHT